MKRLLCVTFSLMALAGSALAGNGTIGRAARPVKDSYIVILQKSDDVPAVARAHELTAQAGGSVVAVWDRIGGFNAKMTEFQAEALSRNPHVLLVEEDGIGNVLSTTQTLDPRGTQFHIDRVDQTNLPADISYTYCQDGSGVRIYVVDTGTFSGNLEFQTIGLPGNIRVIPGADYVYSNSGGVGFSNNPCKQTYEERTAWARHHGTLVASVAAGVNYGIAKGATIVPVRVADCLGVATVSHFLSGMNWILNNHPAEGPRGVINVSLEFKVGPGVTEVNLQSIDYTTNLLIDDGFVVVAGAGNDNTLSNCCSPQRVDRVLTVGGTDKSDKRWVYSVDWHYASNYGYVDLMAPAIASGAGIDTFDQILTNQEGTSYSGPIVAGIAAQYLQMHPTATPAEVNAWVVGNATAGVLDPTNLLSVNLLAHSFCQ